MTLRSRALGVAVCFQPRGLHVEYDVVLDPGTTLDDVVLRVAGSDPLRVVADGSLLAAVGRLRVRQPPAVVFARDAAGDRRIVACEYRLLGADRYGFSCEPVGRCEVLVIDPMLEVSGYLGGSASDLGTGVAVAPGANPACFWVAGSTTSLDFPSTAGVVQTMAAGLEDACVAKLSADGTQLIFATFLGGSALDIAWDVDVDASGCAYAAGVTTSVDFPVTSGVLDGSLGTSLSPLCQGFPDAFVAKISADGSSLLYSTYLGGCLSMRRLRSASMGRGWHTSPEPPARRISR